MNIVRGVKSPNSDQTLESENQLSNESNDRGIKNTTNSSSLKVDESNASENKNKEEDAKFYLILANLPKSFMKKDVVGLVAEAHPLLVNEIEKTKVFLLKYCVIELRSFEKLSYLIEKLNGFVIHGEKLIALDAEKLLHWRKFEN